jgi:hypothetical protein
MPAQLFFQIGNEILGYTEKDENEEERIVKGLKQDLENAFDGLDSKREFFRK